MFKKILFFTLFIFFISYFSTCAMANLYDYINKPESDYKWELKGKEKINGGTVYEMSLTSQMWQGVVWKHRVQIFYPDGIEHPEYCTLLNAGGDGDTFVDLLGMTVAKSCGTVLVVLWNIPNQPIDGKSEDALIAYTWLKYFETGNEEWPLLFPMAKSVIKCMDAIEEFSKSEKLTIIDNFIVTGASKRGWTSWLVGASKDKRVKGIIPMVIDTLNFEKQIPHQIETYGKPTDAIHDYSQTGLIDKLSTKEGKKLIKLVDPYSYRSDLTMAKLIINGTNDEYWTLDGLNLYWDGLKEQKSILYVPNSGHGLEDMFCVIDCATAFVRSVSGKKSWPQIKWTYKEKGKTVELFITSNIEPQEVRLYKAFSSTKDFRSSKWTFSSVKKSDKRYYMSFDKPSQGYEAVFGEIKYKLYDKTFNLSTQIKITGQ